MRTERLATTTRVCGCLLPPGSFPMVPFDKGYYAEFKVKDFSEFWLNTGAFNTGTPLPVKLLDFNVLKSNVNDVS